MIVLENLFGEFIDCMLGIDIETVDVPYILIGGHSIGFWLLIASAFAFMVACGVSKKFRSRFF